MISFLKWVFTLALVTLAVLFALAHRQETSFVYSPFHEPVILPLYALGLGLLALGFVFGAVSAWIGMHNTRKDRKDVKKALKLMEKELLESKKSILAMEQTHQASLLSTALTENSNKTTSPL